MRCVERAKTRWSGSFLPQKPCPSRTSLDVLTRRWAEWKLWGRGHLRCLLGHVRWEDGTYPMGSLGRGLLCDRIPIEFQRREKVGCNHWPDRWSDASDQVLVADAASATRSRIARRNLGGGLFDFVRTSSPVRSNERNGQRCLQPYPWPFRCQWSYAYGMSSGPVGSR